MPNNSWKRTQFLKGLCDAVVVVVLMILVSAGSVVRTIASHRTRSKCRRISGHIYSHTMHYWSNKLRRKMSTSIVDDPTANIERVRNIFPINCVWAHSGEVCLTTVDVRTGANGGTPDMEAHLNRGDPENTVGLYSMVTSQPIQGFA